MRKLIAIATVVAALGAGSAFAQDFKASNPNAAPGDRGPEAVYTGGSQNLVTKSVGYSAADDFGPSESNALPGEVDNTIVTSSTKTVKKQAGYSAADSFSASYGN